jgi:hypothetical protein
LQPKSSPCLTKMPLVRWDETSSYLDCNHFISPKRVAQVSGALLHFKFLQDFHEKAVREARRGQYFDGASEYARYAERLETDPQMSLMFEESVAYLHSLQLAQLGLIRDPAQWQNARRIVTAPPVSA